MTSTGKKEHGTLWWVSVFLGLLLLPWVLLLGWMGLVPGISNLMGARSPENLGVKYAATDLKKLEAKTGIPFAQPPASGTVAVQPVTPKPGSPPAPPPITKPLDLTVSQEELSAAINSLGAKQLPLRNVQIKLGAGTAEISGALDTSRLGDFLKTVGVRANNVERIAGWVQALGNDVPVYLKAAGGVQGAQLDLQLQSLRLGNVEIPQAQIAGMTGGGIHSNLGGNEHFSIQTVTLEQGAMKFIGALPTDLFQGGN